MDYEQYQSWISQFLQQGKIVGSGVTELTDEIIKQNSQTLIQVIRKHIDNKEFENLTALTEFLRGDGFFYFDYIEEFGVILEMILVQAIELFDIEEVLKDHSVLLLPHILFDLIFHQIRFDEYPSSCFELYFQLSKRVLDPYFMPLWESGNNGSYGQCLYFIERADRVFAEQPDKFFELWALIEAQIKKGNEYNWLDQYWPAVNRALMDAEK